MLASLVCHIYCNAIMLFFNNAIQLNDRLEGQFEIIKHMNMRRPNECNGDNWNCAMEVLIVDQTGKTRLAT